MKSRKVKSHIYIGPLAGFITGQSIAFTLFDKESKHRHKTIDTNTEGKSLLWKFLVNIRCVINFAIFLFLNEGDIYFTSSRSRLGFIRDFYVVFLGKVIFRRQIINHLHGADFKCFRSRLTSIERLILDICYELIDISIVLTEGMRNQYTTLYKNMRVVVIPNCYQEDLTDNLIDSELTFFSKCTNEKTLKVVFLSNIMESKGFVYLIDAIKKISAEYSVELILAGNIMANGNKERQRVTNLIDEATNHFPIRYVGSIDAKKKSVLLNEADILALPSFYDAEAQPLCIIEAMALGCAILTTRHNYLPELIIDGINGCVVEPQSTDAIYKSLITYIKQSCLLERTKKFNMNFAREKYSQTRHVNSIDELINSNNI